MLTQARAFLLLALLASPLNALAQPRAAGAGEQHFRTGLEAYGRREYRAAAAEFRAAYELTRESMLLFNLGLALAADGQREAARDALRRYLRATPDAPNRAIAEARLRELDPAPVAATPTPAAAAPEPEPGPVVARTPPAVGRPSRLPLAGLVGGGAGVAAAGVGLGLYLDVGARFDRCVAAQCPEAERARGEDLAAVTLLWGGGVLAAAGLVTFLAAPRGTHATARAMVVPQPRGLAVVGTF
jgi:tetratricopeptide (TPR) repeat protein